MSVDTIERGRARDGLPGWKKSLPFFALLITAGAGVGCHTAPRDGETSGGHGLFHHTSYIDNCANVPYGALPEPLGVFVRNFQHAQTTKARGDLFVLYEKEWRNGAKDPDEFSTILGPEGVRHLKRMIDALPTASGPVIIEPTGNRKLNYEQRHELDERRYQQVVTQLYLEGIEHPETRVVVAYARAEGLFGDEAPRHYLQVIYPSFAGYGYGGFGGGGFGGGGFGGGGFGGGGFGGGGFGGGGFGGGGFGGGGFGGGFGGGGGFF